MTRTALKGECTKQPSNAGDNKKNTCSRNNLVQNGISYVHSTTHLEKHYYSNTLWDVFTKN